MNLCKNGRFFKSSLTKTIICRLSPILQMSNRIIWFWTLVNIERKILTRARQKSSEHSFWMICLIIQIFHMYFKYNSVMRNPRSAMTFNAATLFNSKYANCSIILIFHEKIFSFHMLLMITSNHLNAVKIKVTEVASVWLKFIGTSL